MRKRKRKSNKLSNEKKLKQGRGQGTKENYKPWLHIQDVPSKGLSTRIRGIKTNRVHHLLSRIELLCFYHFDWSENVVDIREQYPLNQEETLAIAALLKIRHPRVPYSSDWSVMTTDFLITMQNSNGTYEIAVCVKSSTDLSKPRVIQKLKIERYYWSRRGIKWVIITEENVNRIIAKNIEWVHSFYNHRTLSALAALPIFDQIENFLFSLAFGNQLPLRRATNAADKKFQLNAGISLSIVRHLIATRKWTVDMTIPISPEKPLVFIFPKEEIN